MGEPAQPTRLLDRIDDGGVVLGVLDNAYSPTLVEFYGERGLDFVWADLDTAGRRRATARRSTTTPGRRADRDGAARATAGTEPTSVRKALDAGVRSLFLPRVESAETVRAAVRSSRFAYGDGPGDRGLAAPRARRWGLADDYVATEDRETVVGTTVGTAAAVESIDEILDVPELGFVFVGPFDLSVSLGHPGEIDHPAV
jgi:2-dehydro-3-deoxyglucarate aldolase